MKSVFSLPPVKTMKEKDEAKADYIQVSSLLWGLLWQEQRRCSDIRLAWANSLLWARVGDPKN